MDSIIEQIRVRTFRESALDNPVNSERRLVEQAKTDPLAFGELFDMHYESILNYVLHRTANVSLAEELTSNTFYKALDKIGSFRWMNIPFSAWLYRIAANEINSHFRKNKGRKEVQLEEVSEQVEDESAKADKEVTEAENEVASKKLFTELHKAVRSLKPRYQEVIVLRYFEKKSILNIAQILGKAEGTVKSLLHRGIENLKKNMSTSVYEEFKNE
jgi:RNA polymerase sigma-70 factor (ECF subfamily)